MKKIFFIILLGSIISLPTIALAAWHPTPYKAGSQNVAYEGLIPCGKRVCVGAQVDANGKVVLDSDGNLFCPSNSSIFCNAVDATGNPTCQDYKVINCQFCHFFVMLIGIINFSLVYIIFPVAALLLTIGGAMFIFGGGNPNSVTQGKKIMISVIQGIVIILSAYLITNLIFTMIGVAGWTGLTTGWFKINCQVLLP